MIIEISTSFGKVKAKPMELVDIHDVQSMTDEESINNSSESNSNDTEFSKVAPESTPSTKEDTSINSDSDTPTVEQ